MDMASSGTLLYVLNAHITERGVLNSSVPEPDKTQEGGEVTQKVSRMQSDNCQQDSTSFKVAHF